MRLAYITTITVLKTLQRARRRPRGLSQWRNRHRRSPLGRPAHCVHQLRHGLPGGRPGRDQLRGVRHRCAAYPELRSDADYVPLIRRGRGRDTHHRDAPPANCGSLRATTAKRSSRPLQAVSMQSSTANGSLVTSMLIGRRGRSRAHSRFRAVNLVNRAVSISSAMLTLMPSRAAPTSPRPRQPHFRRLPNRRPSTGNSGRVTPGTSLC